ncbi:MAG: hypothetical protein PQ975_00805 [Methanobacterium sp.]
MKQKILGIVPLMVAVLLVAAYAAGDNPVAANNTTQTASINIADVLALQTLSLVNNSWASTDAATELYFLNSTLGNNTVTSKSNGRIDVYLKSSTGSNIPNTNSSYSNDTLNTFQYRSNETGNFVNFATTFTKAINNWKIPQNTGPAGATISIPLRVNIPSYTDDGYYNSTVTYAAVRHNRPAPTW